MERVVHGRRVDDVPHLQLADHHWLVAVVPVAVDQELHVSLRAHSFAESHFTRRGDAPLDQWCDRAQPRRHVCDRRRRWPNPEGGERIHLTATGAAIVRLRYHGEHFAWRERPYGDVDALAGREQDVPRDERGLEEAAAGTKHRERPAANRQ